MGASLVLLGTIAPATGVEVERSCSNDGHTLNAKVTYTLTSTKHLWNTIYGKAVGGATNGERNNFETDLYEDGVKVWSWDSADSYGPGQQWSKYMEGTDTLRSRNENLYLKAIFDEPGPDDSCTVLWNY